MKFSIWGIYRDGVDSCNLGCNCSLTTHIKFSYFYSETLFHFYVIVKKTRPLFGFYSSVLKSNNSSHFLNSSVDLVKTIGNGVYTWDEKLSLLTWFTMKTPVALRATARKLLIFASDTNPFIPARIWNARVRIWNQRYRENAHFVPMERLRLSKRYFFSDIFLDCRVFPFKWFIMEKLHNVVVY